MVRVAGCGGQQVITRIKAHPARSISRSQPGNNTSRLEIMHLLKTMKGNKWDRSMRHVNLAVSYLYLNSLQHLLTAPKRREPFLHVYAHPRVQILANLGRQLRFMRA